MNEMEYARLNLKQREHTLNWRFRSRRQVLPSLMLKLPNVGEAVGRWQVHVLLVARDFLIKYLQNTY